MTEPAHLVLCAVLSNFITIFMLWVGWLNVCLFSEYVMVILWALVIAEGPLLNQDQPDRYLIEVDL